MGSEKIVVRLGGIYALEGVTNNSGQYHRAALEALTAFVREGTRSATPSSPLPTDIQAALTVVGRRSANPSDLIDLSRANLIRANLNGADLTGANLNGADLSRANLIRANLSRAYLSRAYLNGANLSGADLSRAGLTFANLSGANLTGADLTFANLTGANLNGTDLNGAFLDGEKQLDGACGSEAVLPTGLTLKPCPGG